MYLGNYTNCKDIKEFYLKINRDLSMAHGEGYTTYLDVIESYMIHECNSYREIGTMQGSSLAAASYHNKKLDYVESIDIDHSRVEPYKHFFNNVNFIEGNSIKPLVDVIKPVDFLLLDSLHQYHHVKAELNKYAKFTNKYILIHDTHAKKGVNRAVVEFVKENNDWAPLEYNNENVGFALLIKRK